LNSCCDSLACGSGQQLAQHEEDNFDIIFGKDAQKPGRILGMGPIIECQNNVADSIARADRRF
jgi:hypothetical protein